MWICLNDAFISIVEDREDPTCFVVRARKREHLASVFRHLRIKKTCNADYRWRVYASREHVASVVRDRVLGIDYPNFKDSVHEKPLHDMYALWWGDHRKYQEGAT